MTSSNTGRGESAPKPPVAMFRGRLPHWYLLPGSRGEASWIGPRLATFYGSHDDARAEAQTWCDANGYYLSSWSDADDRVPGSECICDPASHLFTPGCPRHWPTGAASVELPERLTCPDGIATRGEQT